MSLDVHDAIVTLVEPAEVGWAEEGGPDAVADLFEADFLAAEQARDEDLAALPPDRGIPGDQPNLEVRRIREWLQGLGKEPGRRGVPRGRAFLAERLVGTLVVVRRTETVERLLLRPQVRLWRMSGFRLQGAVHPLMTAVLLGFAGFDQFRRDAELDPPDGELGEASESLGGERGSVVGANALGQAELAERVLEAAAGPGDLHALHRVAVEEEPGVAVLHAEGVAKRAVSGLSIRRWMASTDGAGSNSSRRIRWILGAPQPR